MSNLRVAVAGAGAFGRNHVRAIREMDGVELVGIADPHVEKARALANEFGSQAFREIGELASRIDAAVIATPTVTHEEVTSGLLESGADVLVEKPIADSAAAGERMARLAQERGRILQVGHLERFNPAVTALESALTIPLFFEVHRLSVFTPRSLDVDVVLDLMIHDLDIVLSFTEAMPEEIRAAGISVLSNRVDIANVRLSFSSGCVANLTASRVSTERVRKLRLFQPGEYISLDYQRQDVVRLAVQNAGTSILRNELPTDLVANKGLEPHSGFVPSKTGSMPELGFVPLKTVKGEPLRLELQAFFASVRDRSKPKVDGFGATAALQVAEQILAKIEEHSEVVARTLRQRSS
jgi:predicted dehydrogenase